MNSSNKTDRLGFSKQLNQNQFKLSISDTEVLKRNNDENIFLYLQYSLDNKLDNK